MRYIMGYIAMDRGEEGTLGGEGPFLFWRGEGGYILVRVVLVISPSGAQPGRSSRGLECIKAVQHLRFMQAPRPRMYKPPAGVDNPPDMVYNRAELCTKLNFREVLHARPRRAPADRRRC